MKMTDVKEIAQRKAVIASDQQNMRLAVYILTALVFAGVQRLIQGRLDHVAIIAFGLLVPIAQIARATYRIWHAAPDNMEDALVKLKSRKVEVVISGHSLQNYTPKHLSAYIRSQCNEKKLDDVQWILSTVDSKVTKLTIDLSKLTFSHDGAGDKEA